MDYLPAVLKGSDGKFSVMATVGTVLVILAVIALVFRTPLRAIAKGG